LYKNRIGNDVCWFKYNRGSLNYAFVIGSDLQHIMNISSYFVFDFLFSILVFLFFSVRHWLTLISSQNNWSSDCDRICRRFFWWSCRLLDVWVAFIFSLAGPFRASTVRRCCRRWFTICIFLTLLETFCLGIHGRSLQFDIRLWGFLLAQLVIEGKNQQNDCDYDNHTSCDGNNGDHFHLLLMSLVFFTSLLIQCVDVLLGAGHLLFPQLQLFELLFVQFVDLFALFEFVFFSIVVLLT